MGLRIILIARIPPFICLFLSFHGKFVSQFFEGFYKLGSINLIYIWRMSDCIMGLRLGFIALILLFMSIFPLSYIEIICQRMLNNFSGYTLASFSRKSPIFVVHKV